MDRLSRSDVIFKIIAYLLISALVVIALYPLIYAFSASISGRAAYETGRVVFLPVDLDFQVYKILFARNGFWISYTNTLFYTVFGTIWSMFISTTGAYALSKRKLLMRRQLNFFVVFTMWFSAGMKYFSTPMSLNSTDNRRKIRHDPSQKARIFTRKRLRLCMGISQKLLPMKKSRNLLPYENN